MPVQYSYTSTPPIGRTACTEPQYLYSAAIPLLPLLAALPLHSLSACTVQLYLYSPYGLYNLYRPSVPVQGCTLPYLLPLNQTDTIAYSAVFTPLTEEEIAAELVRSSAMDNRSDN